jgi:hypothetical protein
MNNTEFTNGTEVNSYTACAYAEGFLEGEGASLEDQLIAWAYLIETGMCWSLQGWYGRAANSLLESGVISRDGIIDWDRVDDLT